MKRFRLLLFIVIASLVCIGNVSAAYRTTFDDRPGAHWGYEGTRASEQPKFNLLNKGEGYWGGFLAGRGGFALVKFILLLINFNLLFSKSDTNKYETSFFIKNFAVIKKRILAIGDAPPELKEKYIAELEDYFQKNLYASDNIEKLPEGGLIHCLAASDKKPALFFMSIIEAAVDFARLCSTTQVQIFEAKNCPPYYTYYGKYSYVWDTATRFEKPTNITLGIFVIEKCLEIACLTYTANKMFSSDARCKELAQTLVKHWDEIQEAYLKYVDNTSLEALVKQLDVEEQLKFYGLLKCWTLMFVMQLAETIYKGVIAYQDTYSRI